MSHVTDIVAMVGRLGRKEQAVFALACAERVAPVFRRLAHSESIRVFDKILDTAWASIMTSDPGVSATRDLGAVDALPEATADDSSRPDYYAMMSLNVLAYAMQALAEDDLPTAVKSACCAALDLCNECDFMIGGNKTHKIAYGETVPSHGELESAEMVAQNTILQMLQTAPNVNDVLCQSIRQMAKKASGQLARALPPIIQQEGWINPGSTLDS